MCICIYIVDEYEIPYKDLVHGLREITDWWSFGKAVNLSQIQLLTIYQEGRTTKECRTRMIEMWLKLEKPTWSTVLSSLFKCGMSALGWKLAAQHGYFSLILIRGEHEQVLPKY